MTPYAAPFLGSLQWIRPSSAVLTACVAGVVMLAAALACADNEGVFPIPINVAEAVIEPFWSPELSGFAQWRIEPGEAYGLMIKQNWSAVDFEWASKPATGPALRMSRDFHTDCSRYDRLLFKLAPPTNAIVRIIAETDKGERAFVSEPAAGKETEFPLDLQGATRIAAITLELEATQEGGAVGWLRWIVLQDTGRLKDYFAEWDFSGMRWDAHLKPPDYVPTFTPVYGIFLTTDELEALRAEHAEAMAKDGKSRYSEAAESARYMEFEKGIHEFAKSGGRPDTHGRERDQDLASLPGGPSLAVAGLVLRDADTLRAAARYALSLAASAHWEMGFMSCMSGGPWEDRAFRRSYSSEDIARVLDLAGEVLSDAGRLYLMRRLAEEGIGPINFVAWRHEYIFHCNQLAFFNMGRMAAYLVLEREWPRVKPYTDLAREDSVNNLETALLPDGGCVEGPSYFQPTACRNYEILKLYAHARGVDLNSIVPAVLKRTADFAALVASTTEHDVIPICDGDADLSGSTLDLMSELMPGSYWTTLRNKQRAIKGLALPEGAAPRLPAFVALPDMGPLASTRTLDGLTVKVFVMGNRAGADHTHEDKGSFVFEFAGQTFAMDLGICDYDDPIHNEYKQCQRHNMLVPVGMPERAHPLRPIPFDVKPAGSGDEKAFHAAIDATPGWEGYYTRWVRTWESPSPEVLHIRDEFELAKGDAVEFYWQTQLPVTSAGRTVTITGKNGLVTLDVPEGCAVRVETLPMFGGGSHSRIAIRKEDIAGVLEIVARLTPASSVNRAS